MLYNTFFFPRVCPVWHSVSLEHLGLNVVAVGVVIISWHKEGFQESTDSAFSTQAGSWPLLTSDKSPRVHKSYKIL